MKALRPMAVGMLLAGLAGVDAAALAAAADAGTVGDLSARRVEVRKDSAVAASPAKAMESYRKFLELSNTDPKLRAEAMRRLADLSLESGELDRMASEVTQVDSQGAEAIKLYSTLLKAYPDYPRNDQVLYQLARAYETTGQNDLSLATLDTIVKRYPGTSLLAEVQFRRGEMLFSGKKYPDAQRAYEAVLARGPDGSSYYGQSLYKHGWSLFKQGRNEESLKSFFAVLDRSLIDPKARGGAKDLAVLGRADRELDEDTLRVISITFSYLDGPKSIDEYLSRRGPTPYAWLLYSRLGNLYVEKQRYQDAAGAYRAYVQRDSTDEHAPRLSMQAIEAYKQGGFVDLVLDGKLTYVQSFGLGAPFWKGRQQSDYPEVVAELKTNLKDVAQYYHATAQKTRKPQDYAAAARWYREYLASFPNDAAAADTNYELADALFESQQFDQAATEYEHAAYSYAPSDKAAAAGYAALIAYQKHEATLTDANAKSAYHKQATDSAVRFARTYPNHPESASVLTRAAQDVFAAGDLPRAIELSQLLLARTPPVDAAKARIAWSIIAQSQYNQGNFDKAESSFDSALAAAPPGDPERADLGERLAATIYKQGEAKRNAGDNLGAAKDFLRVGQSVPGAKIRPTAQYDAAAALINAQQWTQAIDVLEGYRRDYPKGEYSADVGRKLAVAYTQAGRGTQAAGEFERIAANPGEDRAVVLEALNQAADLYEKSGDTARAAAMLEQRVMKYPTPVADAIEARSRLATMAAKAGNTERQRYWEREIVQADATAGAGRTDRTQLLASQAALDLATPARDAFRALRINLPLKQSIAAKKKALEIALADYKQVAAYQIASTTAAATYEMAELYRTLGKDLMASERPRKLSAEEREQYDSLLEEQAYPFEEQAIALHEVNARRVIEGHYDESVAKSLAALAELKPARYGKTELVDDQLNVPGAAERRAGKLQDAELSLRAETAKNDTGARGAATWNELGLTLRAAGKFKEARDAYQQAITLQPDYAPAHRNLAVLLDLYLNDPVMALSEFERYKELTSEDKPVSNWIAELRQRTGIKAPAPAAAPATDAAPAAAPAAPPATGGKG
ncbi:MAG TPA: tetratricopeptide repeat protein [Steroidobacteraceae bacterium]|nr:tetratricopeptide repeat protein [Steroidobacteraceae bacterium]